MGSNFETTLDPEFAKNQKMVLTNVVQDAILYLNMKNQPMLQKFPYPTDQSTVKEPLIKNFWIFKDHKLYQK